MSDFEKRKIRMDSKTKTILAVLGISINFLGVVGGGLYTYFNIQSSINTSIARFEEKMSAVDARVRNIETVVNSDILNTNDLNEKAPWVKDRGNVLFRIERLEKKYGTLDVVLRTVKENQAVILSKLDLVLKKGK